MINVPTGWTDTGAENSPHEGSLLIELMAPAAYGFTPTRLSIWSPVGLNPNTTAAQWLQTRVIAYKASQSKSFQAQPVSGCVVAGIDAASYSYTDGSSVGFDFVVLHDQIAYWGELNGSGGLSSAAIQDTDGILGSWQWTSQP